MWNITNKDVPARTGMEQSVSSIPGFYDANGHLWIGIVQRDPNQRGKYRNYKWARSNENVPSTTAHTGQTGGYLITMILKLAVIFISMRLILSFTTDIAHC